MSTIPSMVHRSGDQLIIRSVVSGDPLYDTELLTSQADLKRKPIDAPPLPECKVKRNYSCNTCDFFTQNPRSYLYHLRDVHSAKVKIYECPNCLYASKHFQKLLRHTKMVHGQRTTVEEPPKARKLNEEQQQRPLSDEEDDEDDDEDEEEDAPPEEPTLKCSLCDFTGKTRTLLNRHERDEHIKTKFFRCGKCSYTTHMKARYTKHVKYHSMPMIKCDLCDFRTPYKWNLDRHCKNHNGKGAFRCSACNFTADIKQSLTVHEMNHHVPPVGQAAGLGVGRRRNKVGASDATAAEDAAAAKKTSFQGATTIAAATSSSSSEIISTNKTKNFESVSSSFGPDFIHPDDILQHASGNVYIKSKCKYCTYKTAWSGEMVKHEKNVHGIMNDSSIKPPPQSKKRPIPNLIPIATTKPKIEEQSSMSQEDINTIYAKSKNSSLRDFASLFSSEDCFEPKPLGQFKTKNASFFDKLSKKLVLLSNTSLECTKCGHESKCLTEQAQHAKQCHVVERHLKRTKFPTGSRCQYCRQRCKSSADLYNHLQTCSEVPADAFSSESENELKIDEEDDDDEENNNNKPHPMENRVFVWNNFEPVETAAAVRQIEDDFSLDYSYRTQSPASEASLNTQVEFPVFSTPQLPPAQTSPSSSSSLDKIPTHGNDISVAQHKRVFKCPHCTFWASTASRFHVHIVGHLNKKPFECSLCSYRSNWRWDITKHIKLKSVRDPQHESAKVLMTDETGRRNYTKYNKYLTEINVSGSQGMDSSGGGSNMRGSKHLNSTKGALRPPPALKTVGDFNKIEKKRRDSDSRRMLFKCKKCDFRNASKEVLLSHVKAHYLPSYEGLLLAGGLLNAHELEGANTDDGGLVDSDTDLKDEASVGNAHIKGIQAPFRCGHCNQVSNWKHVIQRHCRLKHNGDVRVVSNKNGQEKIEIEEQSEDPPDHIDQPQIGEFKCDQCPFSSNLQPELQNHQHGHKSEVGNEIKCYYCNYHTETKEKLYQHFKLHGISNPEEFYNKVAQVETGEGKRFRCLVCPYVTNSKSQYTYHKQFHRPRDGQYNCTHCSYNVSKRHLLHQHLKVHGINVVPQKQNGDVIDLDEISDDIEEIAATSPSCDLVQQDIQLVWVSKVGKLSKMFKCRYCPHVNLRKVNIQEHEKMHSVRDKGQEAAQEHRCTDCNYVCNNAGVLSSHSKVHQGVYGTIHYLVDPTRSDEEQIRELTKIIKGSEASSTQTDENGKYLYFCQDCPSRFLRLKEYENHTSQHGGRLFYKCDYCTFSAREKPHLLAHLEIHSSDYQERTKYFKSRYEVKSVGAPPELQCINESGEKIWIVVQASTSQKVEVNGDELMHGNPKFTYPTYMKNGRMKEKRYKCHKCPSAFEKREQYKTHLGLHGSNQRYRCEYCDYSVKYSANYVQHIKKHKAMMEEEEEVVEEVGESIGELQSTNILQQRLSVNTSPSPNSGEERKLYNCTMCPYVNHRRDSVENHQRRHVSVSGAKSNYTCEHCDYSVPQVHFLRDHQKLHFMSIGGGGSSGSGSKQNSFMICDQIKLINDDGNEIFDQSQIDDERFNNNHGEKKFIDLVNGTEVEKMDES